MRTGPVPCTRVHLVGTTAGRGDKMNAREDKNQMFRPFVCKLFETAHTESASE